MRVKFNHHFEYQPVHSTYFWIFCNNSVNCSSIIKWSVHNNELCMWIETILMKSVINVHNESVRWRRLWIQQRFPPRRVWCKTGGPRTRALLCPSVPQCTSTSLRMRLWHNHRLLLPLRLKTISTITHDECINPSTLIEIEILIYGQSTLIR